MSNQVPHQTNRSRCVSTERITNCPDIAILCTNPHVCKQRRNRIEWPEQADVPTAHVHNADEVRVVTIIHDGAKVRVLTTRLISKPR